MTKRIKDRKWIKEDQGAKEFSPDQRIQRSRRFHVDLRRRMGTPARLYLVCPGFKDGQECPSYGRRRSVSEIEGGKDVEDVTGRRIRRCRRCRRCRRWQRCRGSKNSKVPKMAKMSRGKEFEGAEDGKDVTGQRIRRWQRCHGSNPDDSSAVGRGVARVAGQTHSPGVAKVAVQPGSTGCILGKPIQSQSFVAGGLTNCRLERGLGSLRLVA